MSALALGTIGGFVSFASTSIGALLSQISRRKEGSTTWNLSIHFALGLMISASAFSLIGPAALGAKNSGHSVWSILAIALIGAAFVYLLKFQIQKLQTQSVQKTNHLILAAVLMLHNFPEGLASGSALAGLNLENALPILGGISIQNVPEGLLMVACLQALGWSNSVALLGGIASGMVELVGGVIAGALVHSVHGVLPILLSFAGGSMLASVFIEIFESETPAAEVIKSKQFATGLLILPVIQFFAF